MLQTTDPTSASQEECLLDTELILENVSDAIVALDDQWRYTYVNHAAELLLRRKRCSLLGECLWEQYPDLLDTPAEEHLRRAAQLRIALKFEQFLPGLYAWHAVRVVPSKGGMLLFSRDISDRMRALREEAVKAGIRSVLENVPVAITITRGRDHRIEMQNQMSLRLLNGRKVEGMLLKNALPEVEEHGFLVLLDEVYRTGKPFEGKEMPLRYDRDGSGEPYDACFDVIYQPLYETDGQVSGIVHLGVDVTEQVKKRQLLSRFAAERDATLRQLVEGVILTDAEGRITFVNEAARTLHGVAALDVPPELYTQTYSLLTEQGEPYPPRELPLARAVLAEEVTTQARWRIRRPDGSEILVEGNAQPIYDEGGRKIAAVLTLRQV